MTNAAERFILLSLLSCLIMAGCGGGSNQDLYVFEELETASALEDASQRIERLNVFISSHSGHPARSIAYGRIFNAMVKDLGQREEGYAWFDEVMQTEADPFVRGDLLYRKFAFLWEEDRPSAVALASGIESGGETDYRLHLYLCYYLMSDEENGELAERLFTKLLGLTDDTYRLAHARSVYGEFLSGSGREEEAIEILEQAGTYPFANEALASHYWDGGDREKAIEAYINYVAGAPGAMEHVNIDSLYSIVYPGKDDLGAKIKAARIIDEGVLPDASFSDLRGKTHTLSGYRGKILVISAWSPT